MLCKPNTGRRQAGSLQAHRANRLQTRSHEEAERNRPRAVSGPERRGVSEPHRSLATDLLHTHTPRAICLALYSNPGTHAHTYTMGGKQRPPTGRAAQEIHGVTMEKPGSQLTLQNPGTLGSGPRYSVHLEDAALMVQPSRPIFTLQTLLPHGSLCSLMIHRRHLGKR